MEYFSAMQLSKPLNYKKVNLWYSLNLIAFATCQNFRKSNTKNIKDEYTE